MKTICLFLFAHLIVFALNAQTSNEGKFFITAGYGLAGSFFVRSYHEFAPIPNNKIFQKKNFVGNAQNFAVGYNLKNNWHINVGINFQHSTRRIKSLDTLGNLILRLDHTIHHRDYMWFGSVNKNIERKKNNFLFGMGLYYLRPKQEEVVIYPNFVQNRERDFQTSKLEEGGAFIEFAYEYKFQPKVNLGLKSQFYHTITSGEATSVTLFPYIKISF